MTPLQRFVADHTALLRAVAAAADLTDPVAVDLDAFFTPLLSKAKRGPAVPLDGVLIRDWDPDFRRLWPGLRFGARLYSVAGVRFARAVASVTDNGSQGYDFFAVSRADYRRFYRAAVRCKKATAPPGPPPVLPADQFDTLRANTVDYLAPANLKRIKEYGGRPRRGVLLSGPPGNGKTSACRWVWQECLARGLAYRFVTPDEYSAARRGSDAAEAVKALFRFDRPGVVFFDDMDLALRDRDQTGGFDDQAVFLTALDGIESPAGVVSVFTTNCPVDRLDPAFKRPGRIDVILRFPPPGADLRRTMVGRWHPAVRAALDADAVVADTAGLSFADLDELRNLLVLRFADGGGWDWAWARRQFAANRSPLGGKSVRPITGFAPAPAGAAVGELVAALGR
jgi:cell division protease FtsH